MPLSVMMYLKQYGLKATLNSVLNPLCTILDKTIGELGAYDHSRAMIRPIIEEIVDVAHAKM